MRFSLGTPVVSHQLGDPLRLRDFSARSKFLDPGFDIEDGRSVHGIKPFEMKTATFYRKNATDGRSNLIGTVLSSLSEDADFGPVRVAARVAGGLFDFRGVDLVHVKEDFDMGKVGNSGERFRGKLRSVQLDKDVLLIPVIVFDLFTCGANGADGCHNYRSWVHDTILTFP